MALLFKQGVEHEGIQQITLSGMFRACEVYHSWGLDLTVTSITDGTHGMGSLHYDGLAFDCRIWEIAPHMLPAFVNHLQEMLGPDWDVVWHPQSHKTHIHVEYDPDEE